MGNFLNYMWQLLLIIACFTGIIVCLAIVISIFINAFGSKSKGTEYDLFIEYEQFVKDKVKEGCSLEEANEYAYQEMMKKYGNSIDNTK